MTPFSGSSTSSRETGASGQVVLNQAAIDHSQVPWTASLSELVRTVTTASLPVIDTYELTVGGDGDDRAHAVAPLSDGGFVVVGETASFGQGAADVFVFKVDERGDVVWQRTFGGTDIDIGYAVAVTPDGGCVVAGESYSSGAGNRRSCRP